jgi:Flp pilus assembly protein TadG
MKPTDHRQRGTQIVEFAVVLPLLVFLALLVTEGAGVVRAHQVLNNAAREGARLSIASENARYPGTPEYTGWNNQIANVIKQYSYCNGVPLDATPYDSCGTGSRSLSGQCSTYSINIDPNVEVTVNGVIASDSRVTVTCGYRLLWLPHLPYFGTRGPTVTLRGSAEFRNLF